MLTLIFFAAIAWAAPEYSSVFATNDANKALFDGMNHALADLKSVSPEFERASLQAEHDEFLTTYTYSCATDKRPGMMEDCAKRRMQERTELLQFRKKTPSGIKAPEAPGDSFVAYCKSAMAKDTPARTALHFMQEAASVDGCDGLELARPGRISFDFLSGTDRFGEKDFEKLLKKGIGTLEPFAYFPNLVEITLPYGSPVSDLRPIAKLTLLKKLSLSASKISSLEDLKDLLELEEVDVRTTKVKDILPLMNLPRLRSVDLRNLKVPQAQIREFKKKHPLTEVLAK